MRLNDILNNGALPIVIPTIIYLLFTYVKKSQMVIDY